MATVVLSFSREVLVEQRYQAIVAALTAINRHLAAVYRQLSGGLGDAYCSFTAEKRLLFEEGVTLSVRPDHHKWRPFASLSGGQQSLATLALSFALQVTMNRHLNHWRLNCSKTPNARGKRIELTCMTAAARHAVCWVLQTTFQARHSRESIHCLEFETLLAFD